MLNGSKYCYVSPTIPINIRHLFTQLNAQTVLFDPFIWPFKVLPLWTRVDTGVEGNEAVLCILQSSNITRASWRVSLPSAELQLVYSTAQADWAVQIWAILTIIFKIENQRKWWLAFLTKKYSRGFSVFEWLTCWTVTWQ